jgi:hypothetical protein
VPASDEMRPTINKAAAQALRGIPGTIKQKKRTLDKRKYLFFFLFFFLLI